MSVYPTLAYEAKFDGVNWTDFTADVLQAPATRGSYGIMGNDALSRIGDTGKLTFSLYSATVGYYVPGHASCRSGFGPGLLIRLRVTYGAKTRTRFYGRIPTNGIKITPGRLNVNRVEVTVLDWMEQLAIHELELPEYETSKDVGEVVQLVINNMPLAPLSTNFYAGASTFDAVFDTTRSSTRALAEIGKAVMSEWGYVYIRRSSSSDEILTVEGRNTRNATPTSMATISNSFRDAAASYNASKYNRVKATVYPRTQDTGYVDLFVLERKIYINVGDTATIDVTYTDPTDANRRTAGIDMQTPASGDYTFNSAEDGDGDDLTANMSVTATYGTTGAHYSLQNTGARAGWVVYLRARGIGIYSEEPVSYTAEDATSIAEIGPYLLNIDMKYQSSIYIAKDFADVILSRYKALNNTSLDSITLVANKSITMMDYFLDVEPGDAVTITEDVTGTTSELYYVNGISFEIAPGPLVKFTWHLKQAELDQGQYWLLGVVGRGEIGTTATIGF